MIQEQLIQQLPSSGLSKLCYVCFAVFSFETSNTMASDVGGFFDNARFIRGDPDHRFQEIDRACLVPELFQNAEYQRKALHIFFLTRNPNVKMSQDKMKKRFWCGAELIKCVLELIGERNPIQTSGRIEQNPSWRTLFLCNSLMQRPVKMVVLLIWN